MSLQTELPRKELVKKASGSLLDFARLQHPSYKTPPHIRLLAEKLEAVERGEITRLIINMPPRHGKTELASKIFPAWFMGRNPDKFVISTTYAQELADDYGRAVRDKIRDEQFGEVFQGVKLSQTSQSAKRFALSTGGVYFAVGVGGPITGRGAHLALIDDPIKGREEADSEAQRRTIIEWYRSVLYTRLMPGASAIIIINTRWHEEDLAGWVQIEQEHEGWEVLSMPALADPTPEEPDLIGREKGEALWPESYPVEDLMRIRKAVGSREWNALYQQRPTADEGNIFKRAWWKWWEQRDAEGKMVLPKIEYVIQSYDTAYSEKKTADYTAITTWGVFNDEQDVPNVILLSCFNDRVEYPELRAKAKELYKKYNPDIVVIENKSSGSSLVQDLRQAGIPLSSYNPDRDKVSRAHSIETLHESGRVWLPKGKWWAEALVDQAAKFPNGRHDDMVDSMTLALMRLKSGYFVINQDDGDPEDDEEYESEGKRRGYW